MQEPLISVIIPVYNVEKYLHQCLESVLNSTYITLQVILVDDGSTDCSGAICDAYAERDKRVTVIHKENQGLSEARNSGLSISKGEFIAFVDSDDVISSTMFEILLWAIKQTDSDIAACECTRDEGTLASLSTPSLDLLRIIDGIDGCVSVFSAVPSTRAFTWTGPMVWNKLYRKAKISAVFRKECEPAEDMQFNWEIALNSSKMVVVPQPLYFWRINPNSITQTPNVRKFVAIASVWTNIAQNTNDTNESLQTHLRYRAASSSHTAMWKILEQNLESEYLSFCNDSKLIIEAYSGELLTHDDATFIMRALYTLCIHCYPIWKLLPRVYRVLKKVYTK